MDVDEVGEGGEPIVSRKGVGDVVDVEDRWVGKIKGNDGAEERR